MPPTPSETHQYDKPLVLVTPHKTGKKVRDAQWLLSGHNVFTTSPQALPPLNTLTGRIDGEYGPVTAGATKEAKYELGYPTDQIDNVFGQKLYDFLTGQSKLPPAFQEARKRRLKKPVKVKALDYAITQIGIKEQPFRSNEQKYGEWYGWNGVAWCAIFVSYCINEVLGTLDRPTWKYAYVPSVAHDAGIGINHMSYTYAPEPGDLVTYNFSEPNCHIEFYEKELDSGSFSAVGGNTGPSNYSNGGEVCRSVRYNHNVSHFIRLSL